MNIMERKKFKKILFEEIDTFVNNLDLKKIVKSKEQLKEIFTFNTTSFMKNMGSQEIETDTELDTELWDWFIQTINDSVEELPEEWLELLKTQKLKVLCYKYFTKDNLFELDNLESYLKKEIKKYFTALQNYSDLEGFKNKVENLPSDLLSNLVRFLFEFSESLKEKISVSKKDFKERIKELSEQRDKNIDKLDLISKKYQTLLDLTEIKILYDNGLFFEDNMLNRAVNEYMFKLLSHEKAVKNIHESFTNSFILDLKTQIENCTSYVQHIAAIRTETEQEYFTKNGLQVGNRFGSTIETVRGKKKSGEIIDKDSRFNEPKVLLKQVISPLAAEGDENSNDSEEQSTTNNSSSSSSSGGGFGGGGFSGGDMSSNSELGDNGLEDPESVDGETPLPANEEGFPIDFGSEETNPEATKETSTDSSEENNNLDNEETKEKQ